MKICPKCNTLCDDNSAFCKECGTLLSDSNNSGNPQMNPNPQPNQFQQAGQPAQPNQFQQPNQYQQANQYQNNPYPNGPMGEIKPRNIVLSVVLSLITCGIYGIYWMIKLNNEVNELSGESNATSGGMVFLFSIITCGIYRLFWAYKMGERGERIKGTQGNSSVLYLILAIFSLDIVFYCMLQDAINKKVS